MSLCVCVYIYIYIYVCVCVCVCIYTHICSPMGVELSGEGIAGHR